MKRFVYLVQSKNADLPIVYAQIASEESDIIILTWGEQRAGCLYLPKSTWSQGRNRLLSEAISPNKPKYLYYIFLDDDLVIARGGWRGFEAMLSEYEPAIGTPFCLDHGDMKRSRNLEVQHCILFDAMCNAFHRDVINSAVLLPYNGSMDEQSWWFSQWFVIELAHLFYSLNTLQINTVWIKNMAHGPYPRNAKLENARGWFYGQIIKGQQSTRWRWLPWKLQLQISRRRRWLKWLLWGRFVKPKRKNRSYLISPEDRSHYLNLANEFWAQRIWPNASYTLKEDLGTLNAGIK